jgi:hypothetical protein
MNATTTAPAHHQPDSRRSIPWRRVAGATVAVLAAGGLGAFIRDATESNHRSAAPSEDLVDREAARRASPTLDITEMYGAFWAAPPLPASTLEIAEMYGAFWAAPPLPPSTLGITEMYGAYSAAPPPPALIAVLETPAAD